MKRKQIFALVLIFLAVFLTGCQSGAPEMKISSQTDIKSGDKGYIGLSVYGKDGAEIIKDIFVNSDYKGEEAISVADLLKDIGRELNMPVVFRDTFMGPYIDGINGLFELAHGAGSGWIYFVNGDPQGMGCESYILHDGDYVEWRYTLDFGKDIDADRIVE